MNSIYDDPKVIERITAQADDRLFGALAKALIAGVLLAVAAIFVGGAVLADDYRCMLDAGCVAKQSTEQGTRTVTFKKYDIVSTSMAWIVDPSDGWKRVDDALSFAACAGPSGVGVSPPPAVIGPPWIDARCASSACVIASKWGELLLVPYDSRMEVAIWYEPLAGAFEILP